MKTADQIDVSSIEEPLSSADMENVIEFVQRVEEELRDYTFMVNEIARLKEILSDAGDGLTAQYGISAGMPKGQGTTTDKTFREVARREKQHQRLRKLTDLVVCIDRAVERVTDEKELVVLEGIIDGDKNNSIARHLGVSRHRYYEIKRKVLARVAWLMYGSQRIA